LNSLFGFNLNILATTAWLIFLLPWVSRYMPMILLARVDGKPG